MQFIDLAAQQELIRDKVEANIKKVLDHGQYVMGPEIKELEKRGLNVGRKINSTRTDSKSFTVPIVHEFYDGVKWIPVYPDIESKSQPELTNLDGAVESIDYVGEGFS